LISIPNVQTIDELLVEKCQPGDVIIFDRRCDCCASGAAAAMGCILGKTFLCNEDDGTRSVERGSYEHCGIVVPGLSDAPGAEHDPSNLCLLEATSGSGIACRPLLTVSVRTLFASVSDETELTFILCWIMTRNR